MRTFTAYDICRHIDTLPKNQIYGYVNQSTHGEIKIENIYLPEGPILIRRRRIGEPWGKA